MEFLGQFQEMHIKGFHKMFLVIVFHQKHLINQNLQSFRKGIVTTCRFILSHLYINIEENAIIPLHYHFHQVKYFLVSSHDDKFYAEREFRRV